MRYPEAGIIKNIAVGIFVAVTAIGSMASYVKGGEPGEITLLKPVAQSAYAEEREQPRGVPGASVFTAEEEEQDPASEGISEALPASQDFAKAPSDGRYEGLIDINSAGSYELQSLKGIGPVKAEAIIEYRRASGGFTRKEDILRVKGIGPATYEKIKDSIYVKE